MMGIDVLPMGKKHVSAVYQIEKKSFNDPWPEDSLLREIHSDYAHYFVALQAEKVLGYYGLWIMLDEGHITNIAVDPEARGQGVGQKLMTHMEAYAKKLHLLGLTLEVRVGNLVAQALYLKNGFEKVGIRKNYYLDTGEDALIMWRYFQPKISPKGINIL